MEWPEEEFPDPSAILQQVEEYDGAEQDPGHDLRCGRNTYQRAGTELAARGKRGGCRDRPVDCRLVDGKGTGNDEIPPLLRPRGSSGQFIPLTANGENDAGDNTAPAPGR